MQTIDIQAKEWLDNRNGNYYFAALVIIDFGLPTEKIINVPFQCGYGNHYVCAVKDKLRTNGLLPEGAIYSFSDYCKENNIILRKSKKENCLKSEVLNLVKY